MTPFTPHDFLLVAKEMVAMSQAVEECQRLNSFLIVTNQFNFATDYHLARENAPYFFSRDTAAIKFPALAIQIEPKVLTEYQNNVYKKDCNRLIIGVVDRKEEDCPTCTPCQKRNKEKIFIDEGKLLKQTLNTLSNIKLYKAFKNSEETILYSLKGLMDLKVTEGIYDSYTTIVRESNTYNIQWLQNNDNASFTDADNKAMGILTTFAEIRVCEICSEEDMEFAYRTYKGQECC